MDWRSSAVTSSGRRDWRRERLCEVLEGGRRRRRSRDASRDIEEVGGRGRGDDGGV
jgi:hypothetical protein